MNEKIISKKRLPNPVVSYSILCSRILINSTQSGLYEAGEKFHLDISSKPYEFTL